MRPRGRPPMPIARSSESDPVETAPTETWPRSLIFMTEPLPNCRSVFLVVEDEHGQAARLAVAAGSEDDLRSGGGGLPQGPRDRVDLFRRPMAEEGERDVQMVAAECPGLGGQILALPADERIDCLVRQTERAEEPEPFTALDASSESQTRSSPVCDKS